MYSTCKGGRRRSSAPLPPGPRALPVIGSMHLLGPMPHLSFTDMSKTYGPLMHIRIGSVPTIVVSSPDMARQFLRTHDADFANRPPSEVFRCISYGLKGFAFAECGPYWRDIRKLSVTHLLSAPKIASFRSVRKEELSRLVESLSEAAEQRRAVDVSAALGDVVSDVVCRMVMGRRCTTDDIQGTRFREVTNELMSILGAFNLNDFIPVLGLFDFQRMRKRMMAVHKVLDDFLEKIIDEHQSVDGTTRRKAERDDFVDVMLSFMDDSGSNKEELGVHFDRTTVKAIVLDMLEASMDTLRTPVEWALSELIRKPAVMKKLQEEIATVVGVHRQVEEADLARLDYLAMVVKETLRLHPLSAFLFHHGKEERVVSGYRIPKRSSVMVNVWAIGRDPNVWPEAPEEFMPDRFVQNDVDFRGGNDFRLLSFGSGRRMCAGMQLALVVVPLLIAQLVHCFDWELPGGLPPTDLDMALTYGFTMPRANHLWAIPTKRLHPPPPPPQPSSPHVTM